MELPVLMELPVFKVLPEPRQKLVFKVQLVFKGIPALMVKQASKVTPALMELPV
jgi:hypothetical protein